MKYIMTFEQFINEKYSAVNEAKAKQDELIQALKDLDDDAYSSKDGNKVKFYLDGDDVDNLARKAKKTAKKLGWKVKDMDDLLIFEQEIITEKSVSVPRGGFKLKDIEKILKKSKDLELIAKDKSYYINSYMHDNGKLGDATDYSLFAVDQKGKEFEIKLKDIQYINA